MDRIEKLKEYLEKDKDDSFVQHALALEYIKVGNDTDAEQLFHEILDREPSYVGSYYHLGKLLERCGNITKAINVYQKGMRAAKEAGDQHSFSELQAAFEELEIE